MEEEVIKEWKLIETFMGTKPNDIIMVGRDNPAGGGTPYFKDCEELFKKGYYPSRQYHKSWEALMPVVEKITKIEDGRFSVDISSVGMWACFIKRDDTFEKSIVDYGGFEPIIMNVYKSVVGFIQWYNTKFNK